MSKRILYQWVATEHMASFSPRCELIHRILGAKDLDYEVVNAKIPQDLDYLATEFKNLHTKWHFVVLQMLEDKISGRDEIIRTIDSRFPSPNLYSDNSTQKAKQDFYYQWAWDTLYWHCSYVRWMEEKNKEILAQQILAGWEAHMIERAKEYVFPNMNNFFRGRRVSEHPVSVVRENLVDLFDMMDNVLDETGYFGGEKIGLSDLAIFSILLSVVSIDRNTEKSFKKYDRLARWFNNLAYDTETAHTKSFKLDLI